MRGRGVKSRPFFLPLFTEVRGRVILRTSLVQNSPKFIILGTHSADSAISSNRVEVSPSNFAYEGFSEVQNVTKGRKLRLRPFDNPKGVRTLSEDYSASPPGPVAVTVADDPPVLLASKLSKNTQFLKRSRPGS